mmetsp:Transcript_20692/g.52280  ORF Transcript_20692/g.52280 Transcript_20692/m.52280 type:complete len:1210 (-) Transcript_20692:261-3890(-)
MDAWNCERNWAKRIPTGLEGWTCFGLTRSQYVPFWCVVAIATLAFVIVNLIREKRKAAKAQGGAAARRKAQQRPGLLSSLLGRLGLRGGIVGAGAGADVSSLETGLLDGSEVAEVHVASEQMAQVCAERGVARGVEAASLAVLIALQRRRNYSSMTAGVLPRGGRPQEIDVEFEASKMTFAELLLTVDKSLQGLAKSAPSAANAETPELIFAWDQPVADNAPAGQWTIRPVASKHIVVSASTAAEEQSFQIFFEACAANPDGNLWELPTITETCKQSVLAWGMPAKDFASYRDPANQRLVPVPQLLASQATNLTADAVAGDGFTLSYEELYRRADMVHKAVLSTATPDKPKRAVLYMPRGEAIAPAFLGVLQAGFQVVPVDVHWPGDRAVAVAEDAEAAVVLVEPSYAAAWTALGVKLPVITIDETFFQTWRLDASAVERASLDQEDPAIMLFTSGSTGKPKGIVLSHGYLTALAAGVGEWKRMAPKTRTLCYHSPTWMPFIDYLFAPLLKGGCCLYFPEGGTHVVKPTELKAFAAKHGATNAGFVPAMLDILLEDGLPKNMTDVGVGGAAVPSELCRRALSALPDDGVLYTGYSGTEQGDVTAMQMRTAEDVERGATEKGFMGAGRPHSGQRMAILDEAFQPVGPCAVGEVSVAGPGLASGYLKLPEKTAETFLPSCAALGGARTARSGDLAIWTEAGNLKVVGRRDAMVKVRGARIELGEVETAVLSHPAVKAAVVTVYEDQLVAYVVPAVPANLRDHCKERLVAYMVPHLFEGLEELPRLPNGKVNKKGLPKPAERTDGAETVMELDSLGQMRKFTRKAASEDRVLDNVRAILIGVVIQSHAIPLLPQGAAMLDVASRPLNATWGPIQLFILQLTRGGGWSSLAFLNGFDDTRAMRPYGLTYREPLFLILWLILDFNWTMWYLPAFVLMRASFCAAHWVGLEKTHLILASQIWLLLPAFVDLYIGWQPQSPNIPEECPSMCFCPWQAWPEAQTVAYYTLGWWVAGSDPVAHSMLGHALIFIPCYWIGFYYGGSIFKMLTKVADEPSFLKRVAIAASVFILYCIMYVWGQSLLEGYDDRCSSFWGPNGLVYQQIFKNFVYFAMNLSMSLTYVVFIAAAVPVHLKYMAKICFSSLIFSAFTPCLLDFPSMALELRKVMPSAISPGIEMTWVFTVPFLYELVVGAFFALVLPIIAKAVMRAFGALQAKA